MRADFDPPRLPPLPRAPSPAVPPVVVRAIEVATRDVELTDRVEDATFQSFGSLAGAARNAWSMLRGLDPAAPEVERKLCTGIAHRATLTLEAARLRGELAGVAAVEVIERRSVEGRDGALTPYHSAVALRLDSGRSVVLDWHATLDIDAPRIADPRTF